MVTKPESCRGCPLYGNGMGFVPDINPGRPRLAIIGQNPGGEEEDKGEPFVGATGKQMDRHYIPLTGEEREGIYIGNALRCRYQNSNELPKLGTKEKLVEQALEHCRKLHLKLPDSIKLIVVQGAYALYQLTGERSISNWRGWLLPLKGIDEATSEVNNEVDGSLDNTTIYQPGSLDTPILATLHLAALFRNPELQLPTRADWSKVKRILKGEWPQPLPPIQTKPPKVWPQLSAFDTEFTYPGVKRLLRYNLATGGSTEDRQVYVVEARDMGRGFYLGKPCNVVMHNAVADLRYLYELVRPHGLLCVEDSMLAHSVLWSGMAREKGEDSQRGQGFGQGLDFLGSMYASINRWKHLAETSPVTYAAGDAVATLDLWENLRLQFRQDSQSEWVYRHCVLPLLPIILEAEERGLRVNQTRVREVAQELEENVRDAELRAQASVGYPINLGSSQQVGYELYELQGVGR